MGDVMTWPLGAGGVASGAGAGAAAGAGAGAAAGWTGIAAVARARLRLMRTDSSPSLISISSILESSSSSISFLTLRMSIITLWLQSFSVRPALGLVQPRHAGIQSQQVAPGTKAQHHADGDVGKVAEPAEGFTLVHIGEVHFNEGEVGCQQGIPERDAGVRIGSRVEQDQVHPVIGSGVNALDELGLAIGLKGFQPMSGGHRALVELAIDVCQAESTVDFGLPTAEPV